MERVVRVRAELATVDEPGSPHHTEVLRKVRLRHVEFASEFADGPLALPEGVEDPQTSRVTDGATELGVEPVRLVGDRHEHPDIVML